MNDSDSGGQRVAKKHKKKDKKHKHKKHKSSKKEREEVCSSEVLARVDVEQEDENQTFGPALPPHLMPKGDNSKTERTSFIGPALPASIQLQVPDLNADAHSASDDEEFVVGPVPIEEGSLKSLTLTQIELEQRALEMKLEKLNPDANKIDANVREEWMLELPDVGLKTGLASLKRTFHTKERPDFSDRSSWTKTPNSDNKPTTSKIVESSKSKAEKKYQAAHDAEQDKISKALKKKHKRDQSLYEIHQKKLKKEKKDKESEGKPTRRPFSRDVDLQLNKIDKNQTKSIVDKAKLLDSRFSSGHAKYL